jgi:hypothetical protein
MLKPDHQTCVLKGSDSEAQQDEACDKNELPRNKSKKAPPGLARRIPGQKGPGRKHMHTHTCSSARARLSAASAGQETAARPALVL